MVRRAKDRGGTTQRSFPTGQNSGNPGALPELIEKLQAFLYPENAARIIQDVTF